MSRGIGDNAPPAAELSLTAGEAEAMEVFLGQSLAEAKRRFDGHQAAMLQAASDVELCTQMLMRLRGESTDGRFRFRSTEEKLAGLRAAEAAGDGQ